MPEEKFTSLKELYIRIFPALTTKKRTMIREKYSITEEEIWHYFCDFIWPNKQNLTLGEMVDDILNTNSLDIYLKGKEK